MVNLDKVIPILKKAMPDAKDAELKTAIAKTEAAIPNLTDMQLIGLVLKAIRAKKFPQQAAQPQQPPFTGLVNQIGAPQ